MNREHLKIRDLEIEKKLGENRAEGELKSWKLENLKIAVWRLEKKRNNVIGLGLENWWCMIYNQSNELVMNSFHSFDKKSVEICDI